MTWEKFGYPLMVVGAIGAIVVFFRSPSGSGGVVVAPNGNDPGTWLGQGAGALSQYLVGAPSYPLDPGFITSAARNPFAQDPDSDSTVVDTLSSPGNPLSYTSYNTMGGANPWTALMDAAKGHDCGCGGGCGGGCESKCKNDCGTNVRFADGRGSCMDSEKLIPMAPTVFYGYDSTDLVNVPA